MMQVSIIKIGAFSPDLTCRWRRVRDHVAKTVVIQVGSVDVFYGDNYAIQKASLKLGLNEVGV